jgi:cobalt-zinc-cadmium efflux system outer membrane protein
MSSRTMIAVLKHPTLETGPARAQAASLVRTARLHAAWCCTAALLLAFSLQAKAQQAAATPAPQALGQTGVAGLPNQPQHTAKDAQAAASNPNGRSWADLKAELLANNPTLQADALNVNEARAEEITAHLRPNPTASFLLDQTYPFGPHYDPNAGRSSYRPLSDALPTGNISYLHERDGKRDLRLKSAQQNTAIQQSNHQDLERTLLFTLRSQYVATLQAKAVLALTREELDYYDHLIDISRLRYQKGDIAEIDFDRIELMRVQYESDLETAMVNLRQAKIMLLQLLNDKTPVEQFDIKGDFDFNRDLKPVADFQIIAVQQRPDLKAAYEAVSQSYTNHNLAIANGSTDPTFSVDAGSNPPLGPYVGVGVNFPLRIFDRNQGEKLRTQIDIERTRRQQDAANAQVFSDVDSAYAQLDSTITLLKPYRSKYIDEATRVRDTVTYAYQRGGASLLDLLNSQNDFRTVELAYLQLIGTYLTAASQLNEAVGQEVIQ